MPKLYIMKRLYRYLIGLFRKKENRSPRYFAITVCVGLVAGISPIFGQSYACVITWFILRFFKIRFNLIVACALTFISNPLTTPFLFYLFYLTGQFMLGESVLTFSTFVSQLNQCLSQDWTLKTLWDISMQLIHGIGKPIILGYVPWGIAAGFFGYFLGYQAAVKWRLRQLAKKRNRKALIRKKAVE